MNFIEQNLEDTDQDIVDFVNSEEFDRFEKIMRRMYADKLREFHNTQPEKLEAVRASLSTLLNLPALMVGLKNTILENRKRDREDKV